MDVRRPDYDVANMVHTADPKEVCAAICAMLTERYPNIGLQPIVDGFEIFTRLFAGLYPGYHGCDTRYHDAQHSLDVTLAMTRLIDGHDRSVAEAEQLGPDLARFGVLCALFHDAGYMRKFSETEYSKGAQLTLTHVTRSGNFLAERLPVLGFPDHADLARELMHYTGYEKPLEQISVHGSKDRLIGFMLGTADLMAQMSDRCYPEKCLHYLYHEFEICGIAGSAQNDGPSPVYSSAQDLLQKTPQFARKMFEDRLDGYFEKTYKYFEPHFGGPNLYLEQIQRHLTYIKDVLRLGAMEMLRRHPQTVNARSLRRDLHYRLSQLHPHTGIH